MDGTFDIVFAGRMSPGKDQDEVIHNLTKLFKTDAAQISRLFTGKEVTLKRGLDYANAMKYQSVLKQAGALVLIKKQPSTESNSDKKASSLPAQSQPQSAEEPNKETTSHSETVRQPEANPETTTSTNPQADEWSVAVAGAKLPEQARPEPIPEPDTSNLSVNRDGGLLVEPSRKVTREIDTSELTVSEPAPLPPTREFKKRNVDTSDLSLASAGEKIPTEKRTTEHVAPDISHLDLES